MDTIKEHLNSPEQRKINDTLRKEAVDAMLNQEHERRWLTVYVKREKNIVNVNWGFERSAGPTKNIHVMGHVYEIDLIPDANDITGKAIVDEHGEGHVSVSLQEGCSYYFEFMFVNKFKLEQGVKNVGDIGQTVTFKMAIPLSKENKIRLEKAAKFEVNPGELIRHELRNALEKQEAFDDECREAINKIKAKKLSSADEEESIKKMLEQANETKSKLGI